ncbi:MAG: magnesium transporter [Clostridia bacterium]|nr:magnesium transporter [Clostridia bacterium]
MRCVCCLPVTAFADKRKEDNTLNDENEITLVDQALELIEEKKYAELKELLREQEPADINEIFEELPPDTIAKVYRLLPKELAAEVFVEMSPEHQEFLINAFNDAELSAMLNELYYDDTADLIEEMPAGVVKRILKNASPDMRKVVNDLLKYPEDSAGSIMTTEYVRLKKDFTVREALDIIRREGVDKETIYTCYVTDATNRLLGIVSAKDLLLSTLDTVIEDIMIEHVISVSTMDDQEQIAFMFSKYDFLALPVVDNEDRLVGIITVDDAIDVLQEETEEDFAKMAAITPNDTEYLKTPIFRIWISRVPWLLLLMVSATFTGIIISRFESALATLPILTAFIPMLMDTGGNSGSQASVTVIRAISLGQVEFNQFFIVLFRELRVALLCGVALSAAAFGKVMLVDRLLMGNTEVTWTVALVVALTLLATIVCAKMIGCTLPLLAKKIGFDPAVMASPFITTLVDAVSLLVYFAVSRQFLHL